MSKTDWNVWKVKTDKVTVLTIADTRQPEYVPVGGDCELRATIFMATREEAGAVRDLIAEQLRERKRERG